MSLDPRRFSTAVTLQVDVGGCAGIGDSRAQFSEMIEISIPQRSTTYATETPPVECHNTNIVQIRNSLPEHKRIKNKKIKKLPGMLLPQQNVQRKEKEN